jgi:hypothetical protein
VRIVGGTVPDALLLAFHSADHANEEHSSPIPGTRILRESFPNAQAALSAA